jgi:ATP-binding cassette subfamily B protein
MMGMGMQLPAPKAQDFRGSLGRLFRYLRPDRWLILLVVLLAVVSVSFAVIGPKIMGEAINVIVAGATSMNLPADLTQEQVIAGLRAAGQDQLADMLSTMKLTPGQGIDFNALAGILTPSSADCR